MSQEFFTQKMFRIAHDHRNELRDDPLFVDLTHTMKMAMQREDLVSAKALLDSGLHRTLDPVRRVEFITQTLHDAVYRDQYVLAEYILVNPVFEVNASCCDVATAWDIDRVSLLHVYIQNEPRLRVISLKGPVVNMRMQILPLLLAHGANVDCLNFRGETPLHLASANPSLIIWVQHLIEAGALCRAATPVGHTPLHYACNGPIATREQDGDIVRLLCQNGATPQDTDKHGYTPLHVAALNGCWASIVPLIQFAGDGFDLLCKTNHGDTAENIASRIGLSPHEEQTYFDNHLGVAAYMSNHMRCAKMLEALRMKLVKIKYAKMGAVMKGSKKVHENPSYMDHLEPDLRRLIMSSVPVHIMDPSVLSDPKSGYFCDLDEFFNPWTQHVSYDRTDEEEEWLSSVGGLVDHGDAD